MELIADDVVTTAKGNKVYTKNGREVKADVIVLATVSNRFSFILLERFELTYRIFLFRFQGFRVMDCELLRLT